MQMDISDYRKEIDRIDSEIMSLFVSRMNAVGCIGRIKKENGISVTDSCRETEILKKAISSVPEEYSEYAEKLMKSLIEISKELQNNEQ